MDYGWKLCGKKMILDEKMGEVAKGERKIKKTIERKSAHSCS